MSNARNNGLQHASGEYVWFVDSDDCISTNALAALFKILNESSFDFIRIEKEDVPEEYRISIEKPQELVSTTKWLGAATAFNFIVKKDYLLRNDIHFDPEIAYGEDTLWVFWLGFFSNKHIYLENKFYKYRHRKSSAMGNLNKEKHLISMMNMAMNYSLSYKKYKRDNDSVQLLMRANEATQNALFDALRISYERSKETLQYFQANGLYPYPKLFDRVTLKYGLKVFSINLFSLFFPHKIYYLTVSRILHYVKKIYQ